MTVAIATIGQPDDHVPGQRDTRWRRRQLYQDEPREIASSAITAHGAPLCSLFVVRRGDVGAERLVVLLHGRGRGVGPWEDTVLELATGEEFVVSSEDPEWTARRATVAELPPAWRDVWPRNETGRLVTPGLGDGRTRPPDERWFQHRAGKLSAAGQRAELAGTDRPPAKGTPRAELAAGTDRSASRGTPRRGGDQRGASAASMTGRGRAWKPDATGQRCLRCARTWAGHAGRSCYPVPDAAIDAFDPSRPELLETLEASPAGGTDQRATAARIVGVDEDPRPASASTRDGSTRSPRDGSTGSTGRLCAWCGEPIPEVSASGRRTRADAETCGVICRKRRHRFQRAVTRAPTPLRRARSTRDASRLAGVPARFAYADPPYPGRAGYYEEHREVDHRELVARLEAEFPDGWALSTSAAALRDVLSLCPPGTRVCAWRRRVRVTRSKRALSAWEPLIVTGGRELAADAPQQLLDDLETADVVLDDDGPEDALDYRGRYDSYAGALVGMKPPEFAVWMFGMLGARPGDTLEDLYPGSGAIGRAWALYTALDPPLGPRDGSGDASPLEPADPSLSAAAIRPAGLADASRRATAARDAF